jgi:hypothetical protein
LLDVQGVVSAAAATPDGNVVIAYKDDKGPGFVTIPRFGPSTPPVRFYMPKLGPPLSIEVHDDVLVFWAAGPQGLTRVVARKGEADRSAVAVGSGCGPFRVAGKCWATLNAVKVAGKRPLATLTYQGWFYSLLTGEAGDPSPVLTIAW